MAKVITDDSNLTNIANAIREKNSSTDSIAFPQGFIEAIAKLGGETAEVTFTINGYYPVTFWYVTSDGIVNEEFSDYSQVTKTITIPSIIYASSDVTYNFGIEGDGLIIAKTSNYVIIQVNNTCEIFGTSHAVPQ